MKKKTSTPKSGESRRAFLSSIGAATAVVAVPAVASSVPRRLTRIENGGSVYNIMDFGAVADGVTLSRAAIQKAVDSCSGAGGGTVYVPQGHFITGTINLKSNVNLYLERGALLQGSSNIADYDVRRPSENVPPDNWASALLLAEAQEHVSVTGLGTIKGAGLAKPRSSDGLEPFRPRMLSFEHCTHVYVDGVTLLDSDRWTLHLYHSDHVIVRGVRIYASRDIVNTDGVDVDGCHHVLISDCDMSLGDDCVVLKTTDYLGPARSCENITVTNCNFSTRASGFKIGTETSADFRNIVFSNSTIYPGEDQPTGDGIAIETVDGAHLHNVAVSNIAMHGINHPIFVRLGNRGRRQVNPVPGVLRGVTIDNIVVTDAVHTSSITGLPGHPVEDVSISNVRIQTRGGGTAELADKVVEELPKAYPAGKMFGELPAYGFFVRHADGITIRNVQVRCDVHDARPMIIADDVENLHFDSVWADRLVIGEHVFRLKDVRMASIRGMSPPKDTKTWIRVEGAASDAIVIHPDHLPETIEAVSRTADVPPEAVYLRM